MDNFEEFLNNRSANKEVNKNSNKGINFEELVFNINNELLKAECCFYLNIFYI